ncbi:hypothetical protein Tco_0092473 [Tanacetum coccineum]
MLTGKWIPMNREVGRFNSLVNETKAQSGENDEDWLTMVEIVYKTAAGTKFKHKSAWLFLKDKHKWKNPDSTNSRRNRGRVTDEEPELFVDDELLRPPDKQRIDKIKMEGLDRETTTRVDLINSQKLDALCTPESFVTHSNFDTPGGTVYYIPKVSMDVLLAKGNVYESVDDCVVAYIKYAAEAGFVVRRSCQKRLRNGDVKQKYLVCNRKARTVFNLDPRTRKFVLNMFDTIHNHELEHEEFKHLSKRERQLTYLEASFIGKSCCVNLGAKRAASPLTVIKGS